MSNNAEPAKASNMQIKVLDIVQKPSEAQFLRMHPKKDVGNC